MLIFTVFLLGWTTLSDHTLAEPSSNSLSLPKEFTPSLLKLAQSTHRLARVLANSATAYAQPDKSSTAVFHVKQGETLKVLELEGNFTKVRYLIDGEFPVDGWILSDALSKRVVSTAELPQIEARQEQYRPDPYKNSQSVEEEYPSEKLPEPVEIDSVTPAEVKKGERKRRPFRRTVYESEETSRWKPMIRTFAGFRTWEESLKTKHPSTGEFFASSFLDYELTGFNIGFNGDLGYELGSFLLGATAGYSVTFFNNNVGPNNPNITPSSAQGFLHEATVGPFLRWRIQLTRDWAFEPEAQLLGTYQYLSVNQLRDIDPNHQKDQNNQPYHSKI